VHFFANGNASSPKAFKMPESTLALFRLASKFASQLTDMGYPHQVHYQHLLLPDFSSQGDSRKILSWLFFQRNAPKTDHLETKMRDAMRSEFKNVGIFAPQTNKKRFLLPNKQ